MADLGAVAKVYGTINLRRLSLDAQDPAVSADASGAISGVVTEFGSPVANAKVTLMWRPTMTKIAHTWTSSTGAYSFSGLDINKTYLVIAEDPSGGIQYNDLVYALVQPV